MVGAIIGWVLVVPLGLVVGVGAAYVFVAIAKVSALSVRMLAAGLSYVLWSGPRILARQCREGFQDMVSLMAQARSAQRVCLLRWKIRRMRWRDRRGLPGLLGRRAYARLTQLTGRRAGLAAGLLWESWIAQPDDLGWAVLLQWRPGRAVTDLLAAASAVTAPGCPQEGDRVALVAFCIRHGLAPEAPSERARFYALTGQPEQRRAVDPDGTQLAVAYRSAAPEVRAALRAALAGEGDLSVVRMVVAGTGATSRAAEMSAAEREYLAGRLADARDWAGLWALTQESTVLEAARVTATIDRSWRPEWQRDRDLYALLTGHPAAALQDAQSALRVSGAVRVEVPGQVVAGALSLTGRRLAVATVPAGAAAPGAPHGPATFIDVTVYRLPGGQCVSWCRIPARAFTALHYDDRGQLLVIDAAPPGRADGWAPRNAATRIFRYRGTGRAELAADWPDTAVASTYYGTGLAYLSASGNLVFRDRARRGFDGPGLHLGGPVLREEWMPAPLARTCHMSERVAVAYNSPYHGPQLVLVEARHRRTPVTLARAKLSAQTRALAVHGREHVIVADADGVRRWRPDGTGGLRYGEVSGLADVRDLVVAGGTDELCVRHKPGAVSYLDAVSLKPVGEPRELTGRCGTALWSAPDNSCYALGGGGQVDVVTRELLALQRLADRPAAAWQPADPTTAARAQAVVASCPAARPLYTVLTGWLEHKFAGDVRLGRGPAASWADDDIALGAPAGDAAPEDAVPEDAVPEDAVAGDAVPWDLLAAVIVQVYRLARGRHAGDRSDRH